jgi:D-alanyl-D-alanine carboxypeptidase
VLGGDELKAARSSIPYQRFSAWLDAFNTGDRSRIAAFLASTYPTRDVEQEMAIRAQTGAFGLRALQEATPTTLSGFVEARDSDDFVWFNVTVEPDGAHRITHVNLRLMPRPPGFELPRLSEANLIAGLRARLEKESKADRFSGAMLLKKKGRTLFSGAYGMADRDKKVPNTLDTRFRIGSMNKMFTGTAILQLVQAGKIGLTDPLWKYLPNYPNQAATKVTIHQLLTHTGGTGDIFGPEFEAHRLELRTLDDYVSLYGKRDLLFEPGSRWQYSNYGMLLLGVVIERVSGMSYYDYVARNIFKPAGMTRSGSEPESEDVLGRSIGYTRSPGGTEWVPNTDTLPYRGTSAGGGYSTVGDLVKFAEALLSHKLLDATHTQLLMTGKTSLPGGRVKYAYGFEDAGDPDGWGAVGHGGGAPGMNGELRIFPASGHVVVVLANLDPPAAQRAWMFVELRLER